jgi:hypothetical protein
MSSPEGRNDTVRLDKQWRYKFIINVIKTMIHINMDAIMCRETMVKFCSMHKDKGRKDVIDVL